MQWEKAKNTYFDFEKNLKSGRITLATIRHSIGSKGQPAKAWVTILLPGINPAIAQRNVEVTELDEAVAKVESVVKDWFAVVDYHD